MGGDGTQGDARPRITGTPRDVTRLDSIICEVNAADWAQQLTDLSALRLSTPTPRTPPVTQPLSADPLPPPSQIWT